MSQMIKDTSRALEQMTQPEARDVEAQRAAGTIYNGIHGHSTDRSGSPGADDEEEDTSLPPVLRMSPVRKAFCLLVVADLGLAFILWILYVQFAVPGDFFYELRKQTLGYDIKISMFDTVMLALGRLVLLLLAYGLFKSRRWWWVGITCTATMAFVIAKCFQFCFSMQTHSDCRDVKDNNMMDFIVLIACFTMAWVEVYMMDFKVIPREKRHLRHGRGHSPEREAGERDPLLRPPSRSGTSRSGTPGSIDHFYSPDNSDEEGDEGTSSGRSVNRLSPQVEEYLLKEAEESWNASWTLFNDRVGWKTEKENSEIGVLIQSKTIKGTGKILKLETTLDMSPDGVFDELYGNLATSASWNPTVTESAVLQTINDCTDIAYSVSAPVATVSSRDFVVLRHWKRRGDLRLSTGASVTYKNKPPVKKHVRAQNKRGTCWVYQPVPGHADKCKFTWLFSVDLKGWLPQMAVDTALSTTLTEFIKNLKRRLDTLKNQ